MRVIIVEDNPLVALDIAEDVKGTGADVVGVAHSGKFAQVLIATLQPDLIFLDFDLADDVTGADLATAAGRDGPVCIFVTGMPEKVPASVAARWPVLLKPISGAEIRRVLEYVRRLNISPAPTDQ